ncbi:MAG: hypothetical protein IPL65_16970 [Lewinellaceae bacterium]|nr:hypothetical protein [Lewinellaceae bacterium]
MARFDSTMVRLSGAGQLGTGMRVGAKPKKGKGVRCRSSSRLAYRPIARARPSALRPSAPSEEKALKEAIDQADLNADDAVVFDMGMKSRKTFQTFQGTGAVFTTCLKNPRLSLG